MQKIRGTIFNSLNLDKYLDYDFDLKSSFKMGYPVYWIIYICKEIIYVVTENCTGNNL